MALKENPLLWGQSGKRDANMCLEGEIWFNNNVPYIMKM